MPRYFTWDKAHFPTPEKMQGLLEDTGRKLVAIIDPHIKQDDHYYVYTEAKQLGHLVKNKDGNDFDGCVRRGAHAPAPTLIAPLEGHLHHSGGSA